MTLPQGGMPGWYAPYFRREPLVLDDPRDYADATARLRHGRTYEWLHPLGEIVSAVLDSGLMLRWLHEHESVPWPMFRLLVADAEGMYRWPDRPWLPLAFSLRADRPLRGLGIL